MAWDPVILSDHLATRSETSISLRRRHAIAPLSRTARYQNSFFPCCIAQWKDLDGYVKNLPSLSSFKINLINFVRPPGHSFYGISDKFGIKLLTKIRVEFSDLRDHRFNHNFNCVSPVCNCGEEDETSIHFFLCCPRYNTQDKPRYNRLRCQYNSKRSPLSHYSVW